MKKIGLFLAATLFVSTAHAATGAGTLIDSLRNYARNSVTVCPDAKVKFEPIKGVGPRNFDTYELTVDSSDESCKTHKFVLYSPTTRQVIVGMVILLPQDTRPVLARLNEQANKMLRTEVSATIAPFPLPDGLKAAQLTKPTEYGPFRYNGWVDASEHFFIVGLRGNLDTPPSKTIRQALLVDTMSVRRGNPKGKVEIIELSDFECPSCARAHKLIEPLISANLSKINFARMDFPLFEHHHWAMSAALGGRAIARVAPAKYWQYVDYIFPNQETIGSQAFDKVLQNFCEDHDIPWSKVAPIYQSPTERQILLDSTSRALDAGLNGTPTFIINGQIISYGPEASNIVNTIKAALKGK